MPVKRRCNGVARVLQRPCSIPPRRGERYVRCATLLARFEAPPVLAGAARRRERHTLRGCPIDRSWGRLYVHRLSPTSGLGATAKNCPRKRGNSKEWSCRSIAARASNPCGNLDSDGSRMRRRYSFPPPSGGSYRLTQPAVGPARESTCCALLRMFGV